jgi:hypothetical protein
MANGIDYRVGPSNKTLEAMLKSDIPEIVEQAREVIRSQGLDNINMGQNQFLQSGITRSPGAIDFRQREVDRLRQDLETTGRDPAFIEKVTLGLDKLYQPVEFGPVNVKPLNVLGALSPVPFVPQLTALSGIIGAAQGIGGALQDRFGIAGVPTGEQLDRMNALGGYYSDPARQSRQRDRRIQNIFDRRAAGKSFSQKVLDDLLEKKAQEEAARQAAARQIQEQNREQGTGGYQSSFADDSDFMEGSGTAAEMGSF